MYIFNNREIAVAFWLLVALIFIILKKDMRTSLARLIDYTLESQLSRIAFFSALYTTIIVVLLHHYDLWQIGQLKNTLLWFFTVAIFSIGHAIQETDTNKIIRTLIVDNLKIIVILEFIIDFYPMSFVTELIFIPFVIFVTLLVAFSEHKKEHKTVHSFFNGVLVVLGALLISRALLQLVTNFNDFAKMSTLADFSLPPLLSLLYFPFIYFFYLYVKYENIFLGLEYLIKDEHLVPIVKRSAVLNFHINTKQLQGWRKSLVWIKIKNKEDIKESIASYKALYKKAKNPPRIDVSEGWSPFKAMKFLEKFNLVTDMYHHTADGEWFASSNYIKLGDSYLSNSACYYLSGNENAVTKIKVNLSVDHLETEDETIDTINQIMGTLIEQSGLTPLSKKPKRYTLSEGETMTFDHATVSITKEASALESYYINFEMVHNRHVEL